MSALDHPDVGVRADKVGEEGVRFDAVYVAQRLTAELVERGVEASAIREEVKRRREDIRESIIKEVTMGGQMHQCAWVCIELFLCPVDLSGGRILREMEEQELELPHDHPLKATQAGRGRTDIPKTVDIPLRPEAAHELLRVTV